MKQNVIDFILSNKIIAISRGLDTSCVIDTAEALYNGGIRLMEVTFNQSGEPDKTVDQIKALCDAFGDKMKIGAGTVITESQVELAYNAGAKYIISPNTNEKVIKRTNELGMVSIPGALTPTEIEFAHSCGADFVKIFPVANLGVSYIKAVLAPLSHIRTMAVGGVTPENMKEFFDAGVVGLGIGGNLIDKMLISAGRYDEITANAQKYTIQL